MRQRCATSRCRSQPSRTWWPACTRPTDPAAADLVRQDTVGLDRYPGTRRLLVTADCGGSNGSRLRASKVELAAFAEQAGLEITVCHFPPGISKWNKVEHRLFSFISMNWRGRPLTHYQVVVDTIAATTTETGLTVAAVLGTNAYPTGVRISDAQMKAVPVQRCAFHGERNYSLDGKVDVSLQAAGSKRRRAPSASPS